MSYQKGSDLLLKVDTTGANNWVTVAALRTKDITFNEQAVDVTNKDSYRWKEIVGAVGIRSAMVSGQGVLSDAAIMATISGYRSNSTIKNWLIIVPGIGSFTGPFQITQIKHVGQHDKEAQYDIALEGTGEISPAWVLSSGGVPATMDIDFVNNRAWNAGHYVPSIAALLACSRASVGYYTNLDGTLTQFPANMLRTGTKGLLVEEARTNIILRSQELENAAWTHFAAAGSANNVAAPDGTVTADNVTEDNTSAQHSIYQQPTITIGTVYAASFYAKLASGSRRALILVYDAGAANNIANCQFTLSGAGSVALNAGTSASITALANGWYHCKVTSIAAIAATGAGYVFLGLATSAGANSYAGDGVSANSIWGVQLEVVPGLTSFTSSYIPTTSSSATRAADVVTFSDLTWFDGAGESIYAEWTTKSNIGPGSGIWNFTAADSLALAETAGACIGDATGPTYQITSGSFVASATNKLAAHLALNDMAVSLNGAAVGTDTSATAPGTLTASQLGKDGFAFTSNYLNQHIRRVAAFKSLLLSNAALQALST